MRLLAFVLLTILSVAAPASAQELPEPLIQAARHFQGALVARDKPALERLLAPNFLLVEQDGLTSLRTEAIGAMTDDDHTFEPFTVDLGLQRSWSTGAVLGGLFHVKGTAHGKAVDLRQRITSVWALERGAWTIVFLSIALPLARDVEAMKGLSVQPARQTGVAR